MSHLLCFGLGFSARVLAARLAAKGWAITATSRSEEGAAAIRARGYRAFVFEGSVPLPDEAFDGVDHMVVSAPPGADGDPVIRQHAAFRRLGGAIQMGCLSVDHGCLWRSRRRPRHRGHAPHPQHGAR